MKVETNITINGNVVSLLKKVNDGLKFYQYEDDNDYDVLVYVVNKKDEVMCTMKIEPECNQNTGFIADITIK